MKRKYSLQVQAGGKAEGIKAVTIQNFDFESMKCHILDETAFI